MDRHQLNGFLLFYTHLLQLFALPVFFQVGQELLEAREGTHHLKKLVDVFEGAAVFPVKGDEAETLDQGGGQLVPAQPLQALYFR